MDAVLRAESTFQSLCKWRLLPPRWHVHGMLECTGTLTPVLEVRSPRLVFPMLSLPCHTCFFPSTLPVQGCALGFSVSAFRRLSRGGPLSAHNFNHGLCVRTSLSLSSAFAFLWIPGLHSSFQPDSCRQCPWPPLRHPV